MSEEIQSAGLIPIERADVASEKNGRLYELRVALQWITAQKQLRLAIGYAGVNGAGQTYELVPFYKCEEIEPAIVRWFQGEIAALEKEIRELGFEP
jgi:hypothetical protein